MRKLIAVVVISSLSLALAALPVYAACSPSEVNACNEANNTCTNECNFTGAPQSCYDACINSYYDCRRACGDVILG